MILKEKRYLVVLDDLQTPDVWKKPLDAFPDTKNGSRVMLTQQLSRCFTRGEPHQLNPLNDEDTWELFFKKVCLPDSKQVQFSNVLALSYNDLPFHLRPCFLYLQLFPKDYDIPVRRLLCLWLVEGSVKQTPGMTPEDTVEIYLEELVKRSMIQISKRRKDGSPKTCCMLGVLHNDSKQ